jgi:prepilin signal peptidase PulO-like enzyme (type II secretory pathway)
LLGFIFFTNTLVFDAAPFGVLLNVFSLVSFYISLVDWKTLQIPFVSLFFLIILSGLWSYFKGQIPISVFIMFAGTTLFYFVWKFVKNTKPTGTADIFLFILSGFWLSLNLIPFFLFLTGLCGIISFKFFNGIDGKFPFAPAILLALWATILMSISLSECIP